MRVVILITVVESLVLMLWAIHWYHKRGRSKLPTAIVHPPAVPESTGITVKLQPR